MYDTILVPLDGSERAEGILTHVIELAKKFGSKVILLEAVEQQLAYADLEISAMVVQPDHELDKQVHAAESYIKSVQEKLKQQNIGTITRVIPGPAVEAITAVARKENVDLIAMASHGRGGLGRVFYGSVAAGVLHGIDRPLLIIRAKV